MYSSLFRVTTTVAESARRGFGHVFKANPYHDAAGRFTTAAGAKFVSTGRAFAKATQRAREAHIDFTPASSLKAARAAAKKMGSPLVATTRAEVRAALIRAKDEAYDRMSPEDRTVVYGKNAHLRPSENPETKTDTNFQMKDLLFWEKKINSKDALAASDEAKRQVQNAQNYNHSIPKFKKAFEKFGYMPTIAMGFGKNTGLSQGASGQYVAGKVFMNTGWMIEGSEKQENKTYNRAPPDNRNRQDDNLVLMDGGIHGTMRYEYGHGIDARLPKVAQEEWKGLYSGITGIKADAKYEATQWGTNANTPLKQVSSYAQSNSEEAFAETFSLMTNPLFNRRQYPKEVQPLFDFMDREVFS